MFAFDIGETDVSNWECLQETSWPFMRIWGSLTCSTKIYHQSCHMHPLKSPPAVSFQKGCIFCICLQTEAWMDSRFRGSYNCQESPSPQLPQGCEGLLLVQASTHFRRFSQLFLSEWNEALPQPARIRGRTARICLLPRIIVGQLEGTSAD